MSYFNIPVTIVVEAESLEEAQERAYMFMPWTTDGSKWSVEQHQHMSGWKIDQWNMEGVDPDEMDAKLMGMGIR